MIAVFSEFERAMIRNRVLADLERTKAKGTRLGRLPLDPVKAEAVRSLLAAGAGIRETACKAGVGASIVQRMHAAVIVPQNQETITAVA